MKQLDSLRDAFREMEGRTRLRWGIGIAAVLLLAIAYTTASASISGLARKRIVREADLTELMLLKHRYLNLKKESERLANRLAAVKADDSPGRVMEEAGFKGKPVQIRPLKGEEQGGYSEELAEVKIDALTANELVNLLYRLEKGSKPVILKKLLVKTRFDDPSKLDVTLTVALIKAAQPEKR
jgi:general secretion pathway protein M